MIVILEVMVATVSLMGELVVAFSAVGVILSVITLVGVLVVMESVVARNYKRIALLPEYTHSYIKLDDIYTYFVIHKHNLSPYICHACSSSDKLVQG